MKKIVFVIIAILFVLSSCSNKIVEDYGSEDEKAVLNLAEQYVKNMAVGKFDSSDIAELLDKTIVRAGSFVRLDEALVEKKSGFFECTVKAVHTNTYVRYHLVYTADEANNDYQLVGSHFYHFEDEGHPSEKYALPKGVKEENIIVAQDSQYPLKGKLTLPENANDKLPAVILVHDSGPYNMDGSIYDNKPFRDIALYLAGRGIAVLRYDKVTYAYPEVESDYTLNIDTEVVYDAIAAKYLLQEDERIDPERIFVLGHGYGGYLAPRICVLGNFAGYISMAGSPRNLVEIAYDQKLYFDELYGGFDKDAAYEDIMTYFELDNMTYEETYGKSILGIRAYNLKYINDNYVDYFYIRDIPALILQGTNDFQTFFDKDFEAYMLFLESNSKAEFMLYSGLNHLFMKSVMEYPDYRDYMIKGSVEEEVLFDMSEWIKNIE